MAPERAPRGSGGRLGLLAKHGWDLALLVALYTMQGIPMGLALGSVPLLLQSQGAFHGSGELLPRLLRSGRRSLSP